MRVRKNVAVPILLAGQLAGLSVAADAGAALPMARSLPASLAVRIAQAALAACAQAGFPVAVSIVDRAGGARVLIAGDGVRAIDIEAARRKAATASALALPTLQVQKQAEANPAYAAVLLRLNPDLLLLGGGLPIIGGGDMIGAIGVGGAPGGDKDEACARLALTAFEAELR